MPIYEFKCEECGKSFEELIFKKEDEKKITCPYCGSKKVEKVLSSFCSFNKNSSCRSSFGFR